MFINIRLNIKKSSGCVSEVQEEQLTPESKRSAFGVDKLNTAYQVKRSKSSI